jgi:hypothetical protein
VLEKIVERGALEPLEKRRVRFHCAVQSMSRVANCMVTAATP